MDKDILLFSRLIADLENDFYITSNEYIMQFSYISSKTTHVDMSKEVISQKYKEFNTYEEFLSNIKNLIKDILDIYKFKIKLDAVAPIVKHKSFNIEGINIISENIKSTDLKLCYTQETDIYYSYLTTEDMFNSKVNIVDLKQNAWLNVSKYKHNIDKLYNNIYCVFNINNASILVFLKDFQKQLYKQFKSDCFIFTIINTDFVIFSEYSTESIETLKALQITNNTKDIISKRVYKVKNGLYSTI